MNEKIILLEGNKILYCTKEALEKMDTLQQNNLKISIKEYKNIYKEAEIICKCLNVKCPNIGFFYECYLPQQINKSVVAALYSKNENSILVDDLIVFFQKFSHKKTIGLLAHEIRHKWQNEYKPKMAEKPAENFQQSLTNQAEIDADAYAIYFLSTCFNISLKKAAHIMCPLIYFLPTQRTRTAYLRRLHDAEALKKTSENKSF